MIVMMVVRLIGGFDVDNNEIKNLKLFISDVGDYEDGDREDMDTVVVITVLQPW